ncbi:MAG TPA: S41 family peptidase [Stellaceae bacterium]|nr:S41 family peptidase [Stellaceae bacterium]
MLPASNHGLGMNIGFPDICVTPVGPVPVPIPYPNMAMHAMTVPFAFTVMVSMVPGLNMISEAPITLGDQAGVLSPFMGPGGIDMGNPTVLLEMIPGMNLLCPSYGNDFIDPLGAVLVPAITTVFYTDAANGLAHGWAALPQSAASRPDNTTHPVAATAGFSARVEIDRAKRVCEATLLHVWRGSAAEAAGLAAGDRLTAIAGQTVAALPLEEFRRLLAQPLGAAPLRLVTAEMPGGAPRLIDIHALPPAEILAARMIAADVGLIELRMISEDAGPRLRAALARLAKAGARSAILDLRNNGGGVLEGAVDAAALFLPRGTPICRARRSDGDDELVRSRTSRPLDLRLAVLANRGTASSAEILAAALQANRRAVVIGEPSFGKAVAVRYGAAADGAPAIVDMVEVMTPEGARLHGRGVVPDIATPDAGPGSDEPVATAVRHLRRSDGELIEHAS